MPLLIQNGVTENLNSCLDSKSLELFEAFNIAKMNTFKDNIRNRMNCQNHMRDCMLNVFRQSDEHQDLTCEYLTSRKEAERLIQYELKCSEHEVHQNMIVKANEEMEKKTKSKIGEESVR